MKTNYTKGYGDLRFVNSHSQYTRIVGFSVENENMDHANNQSEYIIRL